MLEIHFELVHAIGFILKSHYKLYITRAKVQVSLAVRQKIADVFGLLLAAARNSTKILASNKCKLILFNLMQAKFQSSVPAPS